MKILLFAVILLTLGSVVIGFVGERFGLTAGLILILGYAYLGYRDEN